MLGIAIAMCAISSKAEIDCKGTVDNLSLQLNNIGTVTLSLSGGPNYTYLCEIDGAGGGAGLNGVSPAVCRSMYATLVLAKSLGKKVTIRFYNHNTCTAVPSWGNAGPLGWTQLLVD